MSSQLAKGQPPDDSLTLIKAAHDCIAQGQLPEALSLLDAILEQSPNHAAALALRGQAHGRMGNTDLALADLGRSVELDPNNAEACFDYAVAHLQAGNAAEALAALSRVLQLTPNNEQARAWRERLAFEMGLEELDGAARAMEHFAYSQFGSGEGWKVELREMHMFQPDRPPQTFNAALLDLCQVPQALIQVTITSAEYTVKVNVERHSPGVSRATFSEVITETIPAQPDALLDLLDSFVNKGILVKVGNQLRYDAN